MQVGLWEWIQSVKNFVLYSFAQQTPSTQLLELNTQVYRMAEPTDIIQSLWPVICYMGTWIE